MEIFAHLRQVIYIIIPFICLPKAYTQYEFATIALDPYMEEVKEILQFSDDQGNLLLNIHDQKNYQYSLIRPNKVIKNKTIWLSKKYQFMESIYDKNAFTLFYRNTKTKEVYLYKTNKQSLPDELLKTNVGGPKEKALLGIFNDGDFLVFNYTKKPFTLHTYRYLEGQNFEKTSETFFNDKDEYRFIGRILEQNEIIFVRLSFKSDDFHFYRYFSDKGFEKISAELRPLYRRAGVGKATFIGDYFYLNHNADLNASIQGNEIYLDMDEFIQVNRNTRYDERPYPGVLRLNWDSRKSEILSFDTIDWKFKNRAVALHDNLYFRLLVGKEQLELSIYDLIQAKRVKKYHYNKNEKIDLFYGSASLNITSSTEFNFPSLIMSMFTRKKKEEVISKEKLLEYLTKGSLYLNASGDEEVVELSASGTMFREVFVTKRKTASIVSYLAKSDLSIIDNIDQYNNPKWKRVDEYLEQLIKRMKKKLGPYIVYQYQDTIHLAYINKKKKLCKIIAF